MNLETYPLYAAIYKLNVDSLPRLAKFPREYRRVLADRIGNYQQDLMELCTEAVFSASSRKASLQQCNLRLEWLRALWRTARDVGAVSFRAYGNILIQLDGIGRMVGGWLHKLSGQQGSQEVFS